MYKFLGLIRVDFISDKTGEQIQGWNLWLAEPAELPSCGLRPVKKWLSDDRVATIFKEIGGTAAAGKYAGCEVDVLLGLRGQVMGIKFPVQK